MAEQQPPEKKRKIQSTEPKKIILSPSLTFFPPPSMRGSMPDDFQERLKAIQDLHPLSSLIQPTLTVDDKPAAAPSEPVALAVDLELKHPSAEAEHWFDVSTPKYQTFRVCNALSGNHT